jgi:Ca2+-binding RTX toxin-like protein
MTLNSNSFKNVAEEAGINWSRQKGEEAFSLSWIDYNNDGLLDLWVSGHGYNGASDQYPDGKYPYLYINNGNGTFTNLFDYDWRQGKGGDIHGTTWVDFDNDGDKDVFASAGGQLGEGAGQPNLFFVNQNGTLQEEAVARGVDYAIGRSRSTLWFDGNGDGLLDYVQSTALREDGLGRTAYFQQQADGTFIDRTDAVGLNAGESSRYAQLADLTGDGKLDLVIQGTYTWPLKVYDFSSGTTFVDVTDSIPKITDAPADPYFDFADHTSARDSVIADFNNDGRNDIFLVRSHIFTPEPTIFQGSDTIASADLILQNGGEIGISFTTSGSFAFDSFDFNGRDSTFAGFDKTNIFIGASGRNPTAEELAAIFGSGYNPDLTSGSDPCPTCGGSHAGHNHNSAAFVLDPDDASVAGIKSDRSTRGIYIGYDANTQSWQVRLSSNKYEIVRIAVESDSNITNLEEINFTSADPNSLALPDRFLVYDSATGQYVDRTNESGLGSPTLAQSVVAADFDNDMDLDLYLANAYPSFNQPNILYENQGNGTFVKVELAGGAAGEQIGPHRLDFEVGQRIAVADYDNDGFVDVVAGSTVAKSPRKTYLGAPTQLFHNEEKQNGNTNHWIEIDLQGIEANRDGIGAVVKVFTPDGVVQMREQNSGMHVFAQNSQRLHFGLGQNTQIDRIEISWPNGVTSQVLTNVAIDRILTIVQTFPSIITGNSQNENLVGTTRADEIIGNYGNDTIDGGDGNDSLNGVGDNDSIIGGNGNDTLNGGQGTDTLNGSAGNDLLHGGSENDLLLGSAGYDTLHGNGDNDTLNGGADDDRLFGDSGNDSLLGGTGNDSLLGGNNNDTLLGNDGNDNLSGELGNDSLLGGEGDDVLSGGDDLDTLLGNNGKDLLMGGNGDDSLSGEAGNDTLQGDAGNDTISGGNNNDAIFGGDGNDSLSGDAGIDTIDGGSGDDTIRGGEGNDSLIGGSGSDLLFESNNSNFTLTNTQLTGRGIDSFTEFERARLTGGNGNNNLNAAAVTELQVTLEGGSGNDTLIGGAKDDYLVGGIGSDALTGGGGKDSFAIDNKNHGVDTITDFVGGEDSLVFSAQGFGGGLIINNIVSLDRFVLGTQANDSNDRFIYDINSGNLFFDSNGSGAGQQTLIAILSGSPTLSNTDIYIKS